MVESERAALMPEVRDHEPAGALFGGVDGLEVIREIVSGAPSRLFAGGVLALEVGPAQARAVAELMGGAGLSGARVVADLGGLQHYAGVFSGYMLAATVSVPSTSPDHTRSHA